jgi:hypothetical protein
MNDTTKIVNEHSQLVDAGHEWEICKPWNAEAGGEYVSSGGFLQLK